MVLHWVVWMVEPMEVKMVDWLTVHLESKLVEWMVEEMVFLRVLKRVV